VRKEKTIFFLKFAFCFYTRGQANPISARSSGATSNVWWWKLAPPPLANTPRPLLLRVCMCQPPQPCLIIYYLPPPTTITIITTSSINGSALALCVCVRVCVCVFVLVLDTPLPLCCPHQGQGLVVPCLLFTDAVLLLAHRPGPALCRLALGVSHFALSVLKGLSHLIALRPAAGPRDNRTRQ